MTRTNRAGQALGLGMALVCAGSLAHGAESEFSLSTGLEYSTGGYGGTDDIEDLYVPVTGAVYFDRFVLSVTVPYLSVRTPATTGEIDPTGQPLPATGETVTESGSIRRFERLRSGHRTRYYGQDQDRQRGSRQRSGNGRGRLFAARQYLQVLRPIHVNGVSRIQGSW